MSKTRLISVTGLCTWMLLAAAAGAGPLDTFPAGSLIIPMDQTFQDDQAGLFAAHGLVYTLARDETVVIHRAIDDDKARPDSSDFSVAAPEGPVVADHHGLSAPAGALVKYLGGAWIIDAAYADQVDAALIDPRWANVNVHRALVPFTAPVDTVPVLSPRGIAVLTVADDPVGDARIRTAVASFLGLAGVGADVTYFSPIDIEAGVLVFDDAPAILFMPSAAPLKQLLPGQIDAFMAKLRFWVEAGNTLVVHGDAITVIENHSSGRFLSDGGFGIDGVTHDHGGGQLMPVAAEQLFPVPDHFLAQTGNSGEVRPFCVDAIPCISPTAGVVANFRPYRAGDATDPDATAPVAGGGYHSTVARILAWDEDGDLVAGGDQWDIAIVGHADGRVANGRVVYVGGQIVEGDDGVAVNPSTAIRRIFLNALFLTYEIEEKVSHAGVTVDRDLVLFRGSFTLPEGRGHLEAFDAAAGDLVDPLWNLADRMPTADDRLIRANTGGNAPGQSPNLVPLLPGEPSVDALLDLQAVQRVRGREVMAGGDPANEGDYNDIANRLGGIDHSTAAVVGPSLIVGGAVDRGRTLYVGTLDGLLEAVDVEVGDGAQGVAGPGTERWALMPRNQIDLLAAQGLDAVLGVDGSPTVADLWIDHDGDANTPREFRTVLSIPMGATSPYLMAVDATDPADPVLLWERSAHRPVQGAEEPDFDSDGDGVLDAVSMGFAAKTAMGQVALRETPDDPLLRTAMVCAANNGYRSVGGKGALRVHCFRAEDGVQVWEFSWLYDGGENDIPPPVVMADPDDDGLVEVVIAGDNEGRLWALDAHTGRSLYCEDGLDTCSKPVPLYRDDGGADRPFGASPAVVAGSGRLLVFAGTGGYDWAPADAATLHRLVAVEVVPAKGDLIPAPGNGAGLPLFDPIDLVAGERVYSAPVILEEFLFLGSTSGQIEGDNAAPDAGATSRIARADLTDILGHDFKEGPAAQPDLVTQKEMEGGLTGGLQTAGGAVFGATTGGAIQQVGSAEPPPAVPALQPLIRLFWRVVSNIGDLVGG